MNMGDFIPLGSGLDEADNKFVRIAGPGGMDEEPPMETAGPWSPPPSALMARFTSGQVTTSSMPSRPIPKASQKARGRCVGRMHGIQVE